jgi:hypothetical protein
MNGKVIGKSKRCVYCGKTFKIHAGGINTQIVGKVNNNK